MYVFTRTSPIRLSTQQTQQKGQMQKPIVQFLKKPTPKYYSLRVQSMSLPLPDQLLPPPPMSNAQTTAPFQQMLSAVVGKADGRNSISLCASAGTAEPQRITKLTEEYHPSKRFLKTL